MDFYEKNGIIPYINAHDTYTVYGGSRMAENTLQAMKEAAASFVDLKQMQIQLGKKAAELTGNEAAYFTKENLLYAGTKKCVRCSVGSQWCRYCGNR